MKKIPNNIRLKPLGHRGNIALWLVDGAAIRRDLDPDFTNFGQHFRFNYIPENEFWLDREAVPNERRFFVDHVLTEWKLMKHGYSYNYANGKANKRERTERAKAAIIKKTTKPVRGAFIKHAHKKLLGTAAEFKIWLVDGRYVRSKYDVEFTEGGHDLVYSYVPKNEIWLDDDLIAEERPYVLLHELYERLNMKQGLTYPASHNKALIIEWKARHGLTKLHTWWKKMGVSLHK